MGKRTRNSEAEWKKKEWRRTTIILEPLKKRNDYIP
jgi:hypothetical protein